MIVVLGNKYREIDDSHRLLQPRMIRRPCDVAQIESGEPFRKPVSEFGERSQNLFERPIVVISRVRGSVEKVGGAHLRNSGKDIIYTSVPQRLEVGEVAHVLLDRPSPSWAIKERNGRRSREQRIEPRSGPDQALQDEREVLRLEPEMKNSLEPGGYGNHE